MVKRRRDRKHVDKKNKSGMQEIQLCSVYPEFEKGFFSDFVLLQNGTFRCLETKSTRSLYTQLLYEGGYYERRYFIIGKVSGDEFDELIFFLTKGETLEQMIPQITFDFYILVYERIFSDNKSIAKSFMDVNHKYVRNNGQVIKSDITDVDDKVIKVFFGDNAFSSVKNEKKSGISKRNYLITAAYLLLIIYSIIYLLLTEKKTDQRDDKEEEDEHIMSKIVKFILFIIFDKMDILFMPMRVVSFILRHIVGFFKDKPINRNYKIGNSSFVNPSDKVRYYFESKEMQIKFYFNWLFTIRKKRLRRRMEILKELNFQIRKSHSILNQRVVVFVKFINEESKTATSSNNTFDFNECKYDNIAKEYKKWDAHEIRAMDMAYQNILMELANAFGVHIKENYLDFSILVFPDSYTAVAFSMILQNLVSEGRNIFDSLLYKKNYSLRIGISKSEYGVIEKFDDSAIIKKYFMGQYMNHASRLLSLNKYECIIVSDNVYHDLPEEFSQISFYLGHPKMKGISYSPTYAIM
ncbi:hypothetical protein TCON_0824 [Astathelohania contejeani]|uniref:Guanylate cyclase domain-containing protein n=1 Tax=Astathelohania contejeani TaxID=164912 RepID=A0ABQ7I0I6_9MICR|nr:hypothetical protein TCON_0824 [Thelohania contejeani]